MKTALKIAIIAGALTAVYSCGNKTPEHEEGHHDHAGADSAHHHTYMCPMNCENGKTYSEPGNCPKCGMELEHVDEKATGTEQAYFMKYVSTPAELESGKEAVLSFTPKIKGKEDEAVPLEVIHEKKMHLIIVSNDLAYFEHIHPEYQTDGSYQIKVLPKGKGFTNGRNHNETNFENGGAYTFFADYAPTGGKHTMDKISVNVKGTPYKSVTYSKEMLTKTINGLTVTLDAEGGKWETNKPMHINATIKKGNQTLDANNFENYLGAKAHMVVLKTETFEYLHVHPEVENGSLDLHTTFEKPGIYRAWLQFQTDGKVHTADFVIKVEQGTGSNEGESHEHSHEHDHSH